MNPPVKKLLTDVIEEAADTQSRVALSQETINEYADAMRSGGAFPPLDVFFDGRRYWIADGWHRFFAYVAAEIAVFECRVHDGGERDALLFAAGANKAHGLKRTNRDKRRSVEIMLSDEDWREWSDVRIAEHCGVGADLVSKVREQFAAAAQKQEGTTSRNGRLAETRVGRDGKRRKVNTKPPASPAAEEEEETGPDLAALAEPYQRIANALNAMRRELESLAERPEGAHLVAKIQRLSTSFEDLKGTVRQSEPLSLCGKCGGSGCQSCARTGFWTRMTVNSLKK